MQEWKGAFYWTFTGALIGFGFLSGFTIGIPFLLAGIVMAILGLFKLWTSGVWAITLGLGGVPAIMLSVNIIGMMLSPGPTCTQEGNLTLPAGSGEGASTPCTASFSAGYGLALALLVLIALSGVFWRFILRR